MMDWKLYLGWAALLVLQNASFTWVSRARNSGSDLYHGIAAVFSNGVWFLVNMTMIGMVWEPIISGDWSAVVPIGVTYVVATVVGSVAMGRFLRRFVEKGKRQVGHYDDKEERIRKLEGQLGDLLGAREVAPWDLPGV